MRVKADGVPIWVMVLASVIGVLSTVAGLAIMVAPAIMDIDDTVVGRQWGGRNVGIGVALLVAVTLREARAYLAALSAGVFRDIGDLVGAIEEGVVPAVPVVSLVLGAAAIGAVLLAGGLDARSTREVDPAAMGQLPSSP